MYDADRLAKLFKTGQYGKLFLVSGQHARGRTFQIFVLPSASPVTTGTLPWEIKDAIEVYGVIGGQPGWDERYGWLHSGKWEDDFAELVVKREQLIEEKNRQENEENERKLAEKREHEEKLLADY